MLGSSARIFTSTHCATPNPSGFPVNPRKPSCSLTKLGWRISQPTTWSSKLTRRPTARSSGFLKIPPPVIVAILEILSAISNTLPPACVGLVPKSGLGVPGCASTWPKKFSTLRILREMANRSSGKDSGFPRCSGRSVKYPKKVGGTNTHKHSTPEDRSLIP